MTKVDHQPLQQVSLYISGNQTTSQYDDCIRFHVNGYHLRQYVQEHNLWDNSKWDSVDFYTFERYFESLLATLSSDSSIQIRE
jgi:hypothetical protein